MLARKLWRDVRQRATQFLSLFLMSFLAMLVYAGVGAEWHGLEENSRRFYEDTALADVFVYGRGFTPEQLDELLGIEGIEGVQRRADISGTAALPGSPKLALSYMEDNSLSRPMIMDGEGFDATDAEGIWLFERFAAAHGLGVGDRLKVTAAGQESEFTIRGLVISPEQVFLQGGGGMVPDFNTTGYAYLSFDGLESTLQSLLAEQMQAAAAGGMPGADTAGILGGMPGADPAALAGADPAVAAAADPAAAGEAPATPAATGAVPATAAAPAAAAGTAPGAAPMVPFTTLMLATDGSDLRQAVLDVLGEGGYSYVEQADLPSVAMLVNETAQHRMIAELFPVVFVAVALLSLVGTMSRMIAAQRTQVGTLRALGMGKLTIVAHYLNYAFWLTAAGAALGTVVGLAAIPSLFVPSMSGFYTLPVWGGVFDISFVAVAVILVLAAIAVCWLSCRSVLAESPMQALKPRAPGQKQRLTRLGRLLHRIGQRRAWVAAARRADRATARQQRQAARAAKAAARPTSATSQAARQQRSQGFIIPYNLRSIRRNKLRSLMAVVGTFGCVALFCCALAMNDSLNDTRDWQFDTVTNFQSRLTLQPGLSLKAAEAFATGEDGQLVQEAAIEIEVLSSGLGDPAARYSGCGTAHIDEHGGRCHPGMSAREARRATGMDASKASVPTVAVATITDHQQGLIVMTDTRRRPIEMSATGIVITAKLAEQIGVGVGGTIRWHPLSSGDWVTCTVSTINRHPSAQGLTLSRMEFERLGYSFQPSVLLSNNQYDRLPTQAASIETIDEMARGWDELSEAMSLLVYFMIGGATVLAIVVLYNLGLLVYLEMERELATLKVLGMRTRQLRLLLLTQGLWLTALGFVAGIPAGMAMLKLIVSYNGDSYDMPTDLHVQTLLVCLAFTFVLAVAVSLFLSRRINKIDMVSSLKAPE